jgi:predicted RNA binding protein YcfA (HicA-like mRNA interferase family)
LKAVSAKVFCRLLEQRGWSLLRINGSHHIYGKAGERARLTVPVHGNDSLKRGLLAHLMKQAGITEADL